MALLELLSPPPLLSSSLVLIDSEPLRFAGWRFLLDCRFFGCLPFELDCFLSLLPPLRALGLAEDEEEDEEEELESGTSSMRSKLLLFLLPLLLPLLLLAREAGLISPDADVFSSFTYSC